MLLQTHILTESLWEWGTDPLGGAPVLEVSKHLLLFKKWLTEFQMALSYRVLIYVCVPGAGCRWRHVEARGQPQVSLAGWPVSPGSIVLPQPPWHWDYKHALPCLTSLTWVLGIHAQVLMLAWQVLLPLSHLPSSDSNLLFQLHCPSWN